MSTPTLFLPGPQLYKEKEEFPDASRGSPAETLAAPEETMLANDFSNDVTPAADRGFRGGWDMVIGVK